MSENGHLAYLRGEKPIHLWLQSERNRLVPTVAHHIAVARDRWGREWARPLVMFYKLG